jgi:cytoskeletal protein CcmA (bactofilin family)
MMIQDMKRSMIIGAIILLLTLFQVQISHGAKGYESGNFRIGKTVTVAVNELIPEDLVAAGADVEILGNLKEKLKVFGANVVISGDVQGETIVFGSNVVLSGKYHSKVKGVAANLILSGIFDDNVEVGAAKITMAPTAVIKGNLIYSTAVLDQQAGSQIMGNLIRKGMMARKKEVEQWREKSKKIVSSLGFLFWVLSLPAFLIVGALFHYAFPKKTDAIVTTISQSPWKSTGVGFVFLVVVPVGIIISLLTLVGIPTAIIAALLYVIFLYISRIYIGVWIGRKLLGFIKKSLATAFFWPFLAGTIIITLLGLIPFIGWAFRLFFLLISLGAMWMVIWRSILFEKQKPRQNIPV